MGKRGKNATMTKRVFECGPPRAVEGMAPTDIESRFAREFTAFDRILAIADQLLERNAEKFALDPKRRRLQAAARLFGRARKSVSAVRLLASSGYGEDAMAVGRSLVNLCIDLAYIAQGESDERTEFWIANGRLARRTMALEFGLRTEDEGTADWNAVEARAKKWRAVNIYERAKATGLENFYKVLYRHGSSFEHSDTWSLQAFLERSPEGPVLKSEPNEDFVPQSLFAAYTFAQIAVIVGKLFEFALEGAEDEMLNVARDGLPRISPSEGLNSESHGF